MPHRALTAAARERVLAAVDRGSHLEAITLYRQDTLSSLVEAHAAVEAMAAGRSLAAPDHRAIADLLYAGRKIEAIKQYRLANRAGLRDAKDAVEAVEAELRVTTPSRFVAPARGSGPSVLILLLATLLLAAAAETMAWHWFR